jgi:sugar lactone lactonase YvrE
MKWVKDAKEGIVVAGGHGKGNELTQFSNPYGVVVDQLGTVYVADHDNNRVMRWLKGATQGDIVIGGYGTGGQANQFNYTCGLLFDRHSNLYVVDNNNHRVQRFNIEPNSTM